MMRTWRLGFRGASARFFFFFFFWVGGPAGECGLGFLSFFSAFVCLFVEWLSRGCLSVLGFEDGGLIAV